MGLSLMTTLTHRVGGHFGIEAEPVVCNAGHNAARR